MASCFGPWRRACGGSRSGSCWEPASAYSWGWLPASCAPCGNSAIPKIAFLPVFLLLLGLGHASKIGIIAFSCFFPTFVAARHAALSVGKVLIWAAQNMGARGPTMFFRVVVPAAAPQLFAGIRIGLAHAFVILFAAELIGSQGGLGTLISEGEDAGRFDLMFAGIVTFAILGFVSDRLLMAIRRRMLRGQLIGTVEETA
jgi:ABC-type nitrate/sulfonate/bicarbonate transport system permease component